MRRERERGETEKMETGLNRWKQRQTDRDTQRKRNYDTQADRETSADTGKQREKAHTEREKGMQRNYINCRFYKIS